jgi:hypothetical protein
MNWSKPDGQEMPMSEILSKIGEEVDKVVTDNKTPSLPKRRPAAVVEAAVPEGESRTQTAMIAVDRQAEVEGWQIEAFVDQAIHTRIVAARGAYLPGPRDAYVRRMVLEWLKSITHENGHRLD